MKFGPVVQEEMSFKVISYLELLLPLVSMDWNPLCSIGRRHHEEQYCKIILNLDQWFKRKCRLKVFLIWSSGSPFVQQSITICAIFGRGYSGEQFCEIITQWNRTIYVLLKVGIMGNIHVNLYEIWTSGSGGYV